MNLAEQLKKLPIVGDYDANTLAHFVAGVSELQASAGTKLYKTYDPAEYLYYLVSGSIQLTKDNLEINTITTGYFGVEAALGDDCYRYTTDVSDDAVILKIHSKAIQKLIRNNTAHYQYFHQCWADQVAPLSEADQIDRTNRRLPRTELEGPGASENPWVVGTGWLLAILLPMVVSYFLNSQGYSWTISNYATLFTAMIVMLVFSLTPYYVTVLFVTIGSMILGLAPATTIFSGFTSSPFFLTLGMLALSAVVKESGLFYRITLYILDKIPPTTLRIRLSTIALGLLQTPFIASGTSRMVLMIPLMKDLVNTLRYRREGPLTNGLVMATFYGAASMGGFFLTGANSNFIMLGLLPEQEQLRFSWFYWLFASLIVLVTVLVGLVITLSIYYKPDQTVQKPAALKVQRAVLGKMTQKEWVAIASIGLLIVSMLTTSVHHIAPPWLALALLYLFLSFEIMPSGKFRREIDWPLLIFIAGLIGIANTMRSLDFNDILFSHLGFLGNLMTGHIVLFFAVLYTLTFVLKFILGSGTIVMISLLLMLSPIAQANDISPWVIGFVLASATGVWFLPYQNGAYLILQSSVNQRKTLFSHKSTMGFVMIMHCVTFLGIMLSIPYWKYLGLLS